MEKRVGLVATEVWLCNTKCLKLAEDNKKFDKHILLFTGGRLRAMEGSTYFKVANFQ